MLGTLNTIGFSKFGTITVSKLNMRPYASDWDRVRCFGFIWRSVTMVEFSRKYMISPRYFSGLEKSTFSSYVAASWLPRKMLRCGSVLPRATTVCLGCLYNFCS